MFIKQRLKNIIRLNKLNQQGLGLAEIIIASAILLIVVAGIGYFITSQKKTSVQLTNNSECQNIAMSLSTEFSKDDANINLKSFGPNSVGKFGSNTNMGPEGLPYFKGQIESVAQANLTKTMNNQNVDVSTFEWRFRNSLNVMNSFNRLLALANSSASFRCPGLNLDCGGDITNLPRIASLIGNAPQGTTARMGIDVYVQENRLFENPPNLGSTYFASPQDGAIRAEFQIVLSIPQANGAAINCAQKGRAQFSIDRNPPLVLVDLGGSQLCASNPPINASNACGGSPTDTWSPTMRVYTVKDTAQCRACMERETNISNCPNAGNISSCLGVACTPSDPGSIFLCRFGEKNWLNSAGQNLWQPCHLASTYSETGARIGNLTISYLNNFQGSKQTVADIRTGLLPTDRGYNFDVRAVDASGIMAGTSFCQATGHCDVDSGTGFVGSSTPPSISAITPGSPKVARANSPPSGGTVSYSDAANIFGTNLFQCEAGQSIFTARLNYPVAGSGLGIETCTAAFVAPSAGIATCGCDLNGDCIIRATPSTDGNATVSVTVTDVCGRSDTETINWCIDTLPFNDFKLRNYGDFTSVGPNYTGTTNKKCGLAYLCPNFGGGYTPQLNACRPSDYSPATHSGCVTETSGAPPSNVCIKAVDPCGRAFDSNPKGNYGILLSTLGSVGRLCRQGPGAGNYCDPGSSFCSRDTKCVSDCDYRGFNCTNNPAAAESARCSSAINCKYNSPSEITGSCSTSYQCNSSTGTRTEPQGCIDTQGCSISGACIGARRGTCTTTTISCTADSDCTAPQTCAGAVEGTCDNPNTDKHGIGCWDAGVCEDPGTCSIRDQGTCSCPTNKFCPDPGLPREECPNITSCAAPPVPPTPPPTPSPTPTPVVTPSPTPDATPTPTPTPDATPSPTPAPSPSPTPCTSSVLLVVPSTPGVHEQVCSDVPQLEPCPYLGEPPNNCPTDLSSYSCPGGAVVCLPSHFNNPGPFHPCYENYSWVCQLSIGNPGYRIKCNCP